MERLRCGAERRVKEALKKSVAGDEYEQGVGPARDSAHYSLWEDGSRREGDPLGRWLRRPKRLRLEGRDADE